MRRYRESFALCGVLAFAIGANAQDAAQSKAEAALALSAAHRIATAKPYCEECGGACMCNGCTCDLDAAKAKAAKVLDKLCKDRECTEDVAEAVARAEKSGKPIFVWVGFDCKAEPKIRAAFPNAIHCHAASMNGDKTQRIIAGQVGNTIRFDRANFGAGTVDEIKAKIAAPAPKAVQAVPSPFSSADPFSTANQRIARLDGKR